MFNFLFGVGILTLVVGALFFRTYCVFILPLLTFGFIFYANHQKTALILSKIKFLLGKIVLLFSFWGCVALILKKVLASFPCESCFRSYSNRMIEPVFDVGISMNNFKIIYQTYPRLIVLFGLFLLWLFVFAVFCRRGQKC
ncbi:MAG: hypothetical protein E7013_04445 [Alphaproteobacteria bacterium]|nr:hypothetical protein [Alphaproteobacteria bacterium]